MLKCSSYQNSIEYLLKCQCGARQKPSQSKPSEKKRSKNRSSVWLHAIRRSFSDVSSEIQPKKRYFKKKWDRIKRPTNTYILIFREAVYNEYWWATSLLHKVTEIVKYRRMKLDHCLSPITHVKCK